MFQFKKPKNELELILRQGKAKTPVIPDEMFTPCPGCNAPVLTEELHENKQVCTKCSYHFPQNARQRIAMIADAGSFMEHDTECVSRNILEFPDYDGKLKNAKLASAENEAVITGSCKIKGNACAVFVMERAFMMGSMGAVTGEKITRIFECAVSERLPVIGFTVSGGARMQEGIISLMQMAKTSGAVARHSASGFLYIVMLTNPTTGGVTASFAMQGDIILAEPGALVGFAGPRVIAQTTRQKLPEGFQTAEFVLEKGFIDAIVERGAQRDTLAKLLSIHGGGAYESD